MKSITILLASVGLAAANIHNWVVQNFSARADVVKTAKPPPVSQMLVSFDLAIGNHFFHCDHLGTQPDSVGFFNVTKVPCLNKVRSESNIPLGVQFDFIQFDPPLPMPMVSGRFQRRGHAGAQLLIRSKGFESSTMIDSAHLLPCKRDKLSLNTSPVLDSKAICDYHGPKTMQMFPMSKTKPVPVKSRSTPTSIPMNSRAVFDSKQASGWSVTDFKAFSMAHSMVSEISFILHPDTNTRITCTSKGRSHFSDILTNVTDAPCVGTGGWKFSFTQFDAPKRMTTRPHNGSTEKPGNESMIAGAALTVHQGDGNKSATHVFEDISFQSCQSGREGTCPMCISVVFNGKADFELDMVRRWVGEDQDKGQDQDENKEESDEGEESCSDSDSDNDSDTDEDDDEDDNDDDDDDDEDDDGDDDEEEEDDNDDEDDEEE